MNFRAMPRQSMNSIRIHPRSGNVCHMLVFSGCAAIKAEYLSTAFLNMKKKHIRTTTVPEMSHHDSCKGIDKYALTPLTVMMTPGIPQSAAAPKYKAQLFISDSNCQPCTSILKKLVKFTRFKVLQHLVGRFSKHRQVFPYSIKDCFIINI